MVNIKVTQSNIREQVNTKQTKALKLGLGQRGKRLESGGLYNTLVYWEQVDMLHQCSYRPKHRNRARMECNWTGCANSTCGAVGLTNRPAVISDRYNKCHSLPPKSHYAHFPPLQHTHKFSRKTQLCGIGPGNDYGFRGIACWPLQEECYVLG